MMYYMVLMSNPTLTVADLLELLPLDGGRLSERQLEDVATTVAAAPELWQHLVGDEPPSVRRRIGLHVTDSFEVLLIVWSRWEWSGWHDHGGSSGGFAVVRGALRERFRAADGRGVDEHVLPAGRHGSFGPTHLHDIGESPDRRGPAVSIHSYSPPLAVSTYYDRTPLGFVARELVPQAGQAEAAETAGTGFTQI
jgi:Cysteine dioxygenase type I